MIEHEYLERRRLEGTFTRAGMTMTFKGWCYPLEAYSRALESAGLLIEAIREPPGPPPGPEPPESYEADRRFPNFLMLRARRQ